MRWYGLPGVWHICRVFVVWLILTIEIPPIIRVSKLLGARQCPAEGFSDDITRFYHSYIQLGLGFFRWYPIMKSSTHNDQEKEGLPNE